jgi:hypothetical protein
MIIIGNEHILEAVELFPANIRGGVKKRRGTRVMKGGLSETLKGKKLVDNSPFITEAMLLVLFYFLRFVLPACAG